MTTITQDQALKLKLLVLDVDGVMTPGSLSFDAEGVETKTFNVKDGLGIKLLQRVGVRTAIITGRISAMVQARADMLGITEVIQGREDKGAALSEMLDQLGLSFDQCAYMGDDLPDLSALLQVSLSACPHDAHSEVVARVDWVSAFTGGHGAVRDFCDLILRARGEYDGLIERYTAVTGVAKMGS